MNKRKEAFVNDFIHLLRKHKVDFNSWDAYGPNECTLPNEYVFEDYKGFNMSVDELIKSINDKEIAHRREIKKQMLKEAREKRKREKNKT